VNRPIRASEIGAFAFCERAWGYAARGEPSERQPERDVGTAYHTRVLRRAAWSGTLYRLGLACLLLAAVVLFLAIRT
jgi:hypothetical protein